MVAEKLLALEVDLERSSIFFLFALIIGVENNNLLGHSCQLSAQKITDIETANRQSLTTVFVSCSVFLDGQPGQVRLGYVYVLWYY